METSVVGEEYCVSEKEGERELTVRKTSLFFPGDGFEAYDHNTGELVFRVDMYGRGHSVAADQLLLMDPGGAPILTVRRKETLNITVNKKDGSWPSLHQRWEGFTGERQENQKPLFTVRRSSIFGGDRSGVAVEVHAGAATSAAEYRVEGSFGQRCCRVLYEDEQETVVAAEIRRKVDKCTHVVVLGRDVFCLFVKPRFDVAFVMGVVLVLDQICGDDERADSGDVVDDGTEINGVCES